MDAGVKISDSKTNQEWLQASDYFHMLSHYQEYCLKLGLKVLDVHPQHIYTKPIGNIQYERHPII